MKQTLLFICLTLYITIATAQSNFQKGYIITQDDQRQEGWIDFRSWDLNPTKISFKADEGQTAASLTAEDIKFFEVTGKASYKSLLVTASQDKISPPDKLSIGPDTSTARITAFFRIIYQGEELVLYDYEDKIKLRFFIKENSNVEAEELKYKRYYTISPVTNNVSANITEDISYKHQLIAIAQRRGVDAAMIIRQLDQTKYQESDLKKLIRLLDNTQAKNSTDANQPSKFRLYAGAGMTGTWVKYSGGFTPLTERGTKSNFSLMPKVAFGFDYFTRPQIKKWWIRADVALTAAHQNITLIKTGGYKGYITQEYNQYSVQLTPQSIYNLYNTHALKINAGIGFGLSYSLYANNKYIEDYTGPTVFDGNYVTREEHLLPVQMHFMSRAGATLFNKADIYVQANYPGSSLVETIGYSIKSYALHFGVNYLF